MTENIDLGFLAQEGLTHFHGTSPWISVGMGTCGIGSGADTIWDALSQKVVGTPYRLRRVGCFGFCAAEPAVMTWRPNKPILLFTDTDVPKALKILVGLQAMLHTTELQNGRSKD